MPAFARMAALWGRCALVLSLAALTPLTVAQAQPPAQPPAQPQAPTQAEGGAPDGSGAMRGERFFLAVPEQWQEVARAREQGSDVVAYVPDGQGAEQWADMLTVQVFHGMTALPAQSFYERTRTNYRSSCDQIRVGELQTGLSNGYPSAFWVLACTRNRSTGLGETAFFRLIQGDTALYLAQRSWRLQPFALDAGPPLSQGETKRAVGTLKTFGVCNPAVPGHPCPVLEE